MKISNLKKYFVLLIFILFLTGCKKSIVGTTTSGGFIIEDTKCNFIGNWTSNWGDMSFFRNETNVTANYTHDSGRINGMMKGNILIGRWSEYPSYLEPNDAGQVELELSQNCSSFKGVWKYGDKGTWSGDWTGTRK